ncbi:MAG TPA: hypothetical protein VFQ53_23845 [Kofleriaceae bacterium]|nr:hypothetical protein [Kofleriaceae bacterium]
MTRLAVALVLGSALAGAACGHGKQPSTGVQRSDAIVVFKSNVRDAQLYVDGRFIAPLDAMSGGVAVEPGVHRFELRHEDYFSSYLELTLARAERRKVSLELAPILP